MQVIGHTCSLLLVLLICLCFLCVCVFRACVYVCVFFRVDFCFTCLHELFACLYGCPCWSACSCLSVCICLYVRLSASGCVYVGICLCLSFRKFSLYLFISVSASVGLPALAFLFVSVFMSDCLRLSVFMCAFVCVSLSVSPLYVCSYLCLSCSVPLSLCPSLSISLSLIPPSLCSHHPSSRLLLSIPHGTKNPNHNVKEERHLGMQYAVHRCSFVMLLWAIKAVRA